MQPRGESMSWLRACALVGGGLLGCAHAPAPITPARADVEVAQLRAQLAERDRTIRELEGRLALAASPVASEPMVMHETVRIPSSSLAHDERAPNVVAEPVAEPAQRSAKAAEPRPFLRLHEKSEPSGARAAEPVARSSALEVGGDEPRASTGERLSVVALPSAGTSADAAADDLYLRAIDLVRRREFAAALRELDAFLQSFADDPRSARAFYWRGEVLFAQREYARALASYEGALARAPDGDKAPDALLRIARCSLKLGAKERAHAVLAQLEARFPESDAARALKREPPDEDG